MFVLAVCIIRVTLHHCHHCSAPYMVARELVSSAASKGKLSRRLGRVGRGVIGGELSEGTAEAGGCSDQERCNLFDVIIHVTTLGRQQVTEKGAGNEELHSPSLHVFV